MDGGTAGANCEANTTTPRHLAVKGHRSNVKILFGLVHQNVQDRDSLGSSCTTQDVTGILTGQGYLAGSKSLRKVALEGERDRENIQRPQGCGAR